MSEPNATGNRRNGKNLSTKEDELPQTSLSGRIEAALEGVGRGLSWVWLLLLGVIVLNVTLRYAFASGRIEFEETQWHLYAVGFLGALAYCVKNDSHIRVDVFSERFSPRMRAWIDLYGILLLGLPFCALILYFSVPFVEDSYLSGEISASPGGLPGRFLIKSALPAGFLMLALAFIARLMRVGRLLFGSARSPGKV
jgi:TRAP-type mannitol/chloroaromatic compound transport system permease small subunit